MSHWILASQTIEALRAEARHRTPNELGNSGFFDSLRCFQEAFVFYVCSLLQTLEDWYPEKVKETACLFLKRCYLHRSVAEDDPRCMLLAAVYAACKASEQHVSAAELVRHVARCAAALPPDAPLTASVKALADCSADDIVRHEVRLLEALRFELHVARPGRALLGLWQHAQTSCAEFAAAPAAVRDLVWDEARQELDRRLQLTDAALLTTPSLLAVACLTDAARGSALEAPLQRVVRCAAAAAGGGDGAEVGGDIAAQAPAEAAAAADAGGRHERLEQMLLRAQAAAAAVERHWQQQAAAAIADQ
eukprot:TRINITY_DN1507_c0_g1_i1.p1 TRINITY_DN1507_c0_g1~~TRINITY_DN1507_c0_g1_i1.p1  ORF type:complete len:306 (+),score=78.37 TRINITY_DN1507_c0_g1_i1:423-1340(+)